MKKIIILILLTFAHLSMQAQELTVKSFVVRTNDLTARTQPRTDANGNKCALIRVQIPQGNVQFKGKVVGTPSFIINEYLVYMEKGATDLIVKVPSCREVSIDFNVWGIHGLESETTYNLVADVSTSEHPSFVTEENGKTAIDLGLSVKWAAYNVGASLPCDYGNYYAWGETTEKKQYTSETYKYGDEYVDKPLKKYSKIDNKYTLDAIDDVAHVKWGGNWRMPTMEEFEELVENCIWEPETINNVQGIKATGPSGESIFFPRAGFWSGYLTWSTLQDSGLKGYYWTSSIDETGRAIRFGYYGKKPHLGVSWGSRYEGCNIRPVCP